MNEHLSERFGRSGASRKPYTKEADVLILPQRLNVLVHSYFDNQQRPTDAGAWIDMPEIPSTDEIMAESSTLSIDSEPKNTKEKLLSSQYNILREEAVGPLRDAVAMVRARPLAIEQDLGNSIGIYEKVHFIAVTLSTRGVATRITFSIARAQKQVLWEQSKRLISGSLVVLSPASDMFQTKAIVATIAARPLAALQQNPPELDLFIPRAEEMEIDPAVEWVMVEERSGLFEAERHTLLALQKQMAEPLPLAQYLYGPKEAVAPPAYLQQKPKLDLTDVLINNKHQVYDSVDVLRKWPAAPESDLDASQLAALQRILTKELAIVQGPPGTGKTFVSVQAIKVMLANRAEDDPPLILTCQTNHALDQLLRHVAQFEPEFARLGGRSKDRDVIKARTLYELRRQTSENSLPGSQFPAARKKMKDLEKEIVALLAPLRPSKQPLDVKTLLTLGLLSEAQAKSLETGASEWVQTERSNPNLAHSPFTIWLNQQLVPVPLKPVAEDLGFEYEEADLEFEQLKELEAEGFLKDDEDFDTLSGNTYPLADNFTCRKIPGLTEQKVKDILKSKPDLWKVSEAARGGVYRYLQSEMKKKLLENVRPKVKAYNDAAIRRKIGNWEKDETILSKQKVIGLTTTGFSKYRALIAALKPKVVLIEEAAETLEPPVIVTCVPSLQQLILVGDHQQLRPHCRKKEHEKAPYFFNVSLFERMVNKGVDYDILNKQRRMVPEIRRILYPIYGDAIKDHASVLNSANRPDVPGMGGVNSYFFHHQWPETRDDYMSCVNTYESDMIIGFMEHLVYNGMDTENITILTFYNGQRKQILSGLRKSISLADRKFNVVTVDSYQGEENDVVILSLVRSNDKKQIGFLNVINRVCVALSRAKCGMYIFGNGALLHDQSKTWRQVTEIMAGTKRKSERPKLMSCRFAGELPIQCVKHHNRVFLKEPNDWVDLYGGCQEPCSGVLPCDHACALTCHPFAHDELICVQPCLKVLGCGHKCGKECNEACKCTKCKNHLTIATTAQPRSLDDAEDSSADSSSVSVKSWRSFSETEPAKYAADAAAALVKASGSPGPSKTSPQKASPLKKMRNSESLPSEPGRNMAEKETEQLASQLASQLERLATASPAASSSTLKGGKANFAPGKEAGQLASELDRFTTTSQTISSTRKDGKAKSTAAIVPPPLSKEDMSLMKDWSREQSLLD